MLPLLISSTMVFPQTKINGIITDNLNEPLIGAIAFVKGNGKAVVFNAPSNNSKENLTADN